ncbi:cation:proton antiporter [Desulfogranum japonicum]|uniref:cation:proton antiporter n=1 Tax=Desulfogranum japonicum TaxID=231447 RepID=UPI00040BAF67|nr:cation:proton antiporter [Desulfogranum japonicum]
MVDVTLGLAILLATGMLFAHIAKQFSLPSVTGFILAGLVLGPSGFGWLTEQTVGHKLDHFTQIALMLIAFGIGEHVELRKLGAISKHVLTICCSQALVTFLLVSTSTLVVSWLFAAEHAMSSHIILALLLGALSLPSAPAAILHMVREFEAKGPLTSILMAVIAMGDALAIMIYGITLSIAHQLQGSGAGSLFAGIIGSFSEIGGSIIIGTCTGLLIDVTLHKLHTKGEMLTAGLALLLLCGELTQLMGFSPLLAGMAAGFILINREERDVRLFRNLNGFEPPMYVLFFTLAGVHLDLSMLSQAGWVGLTYFIARIIGKYAGSRLGAMSSHAEPVVRKYLGLAMIPQAGVAIGLVFILAGDALLVDYAPRIIPIVLAGVVLAELFGPILARQAFIKSNEVSPDVQQKDSGKGQSLLHRAFFHSEELSLAPWTNDKLYPSGAPQGVVIFGAANYATVRGLARVATILAHHFYALPMSVRVLENKLDEEKIDLAASSRFLPETDEVNNMGYSLLTWVEYGVAATRLIAAVNAHHTKALVLGYPLGRTPMGIQKIVDKVASSVPCPVVAVRFVGRFSSNSILVPFLHVKELDDLLPILEAMGAASQPVITLMQMMPADCTRQDLQMIEREISEWAELNLLEFDTNYHAVAAESRLEAILKEAKKHDLIILKAVRMHGVNRFFRGSLANAVVKNCSNSVFAVYSNHD